MSAPIPGRALKIARESRRWTQLELAKKLTAAGTKIGQYQVSRLEKISEIPEWIVPALDAVFGGAEWRGAGPSLRESGPDYQAVERKVDALTNLVERLLQRVEALEGARRPVRK
jgi:transcriptional regulator with XRE-family HTH domain